MILKTEFPSEHHVEKVYTHICAHAVLMLNRRVVVAPLLTTISVDCAARWRLVCVGEHSATRPSLTGENVYGQGEMQGTTVIVKNATATNALAPMWTPWRAGNRRDSIVPGRVCQ